MPILLDGSVEAVELLGRPCGPVARAGIVRPDGKDTVQPGQGSTRIVPIEVDAGLDESAICVIVDSLRDLESSIVVPGSREQISERQELERAHFLSWTETSLVGGRSRREIAQSDMVIGKRSPCVARDGRIRPLRSLDQNRLRVFEAAHREEPPNQEDSEQAVIRVALQGREQLPVRLVDTTSRIEVGHESFEQAPTIRMP
ncbi:MAG TPA: hypothetical protein PLW10_15885, partial [Myxococcota bacterium]|nr:hypothetical protein [Myxococcota bacterium]